MSDFFLSLHRGQQLVFRQGFRRVIDTAQGKIPESRFPATIRFEPCPPTRCPGLANKEQAAHGMLSCERAAAYCRQRGWDDVTAGDIEAFLLGHEDYGRLFAAIDDAGKVVGKPSGEPSYLDERGFIVGPQADGSYFCSLCNQHLKTHQGALLHQARSSEHAEQVAHWEAENKQKIDHQAAVSLRSPSAPKHQEVSP